jgi:hypothetical protein
MVDRITDENNNVNLKFSDIPLQVIKCSDYLTKEIVGDQQITFPYENVLLYKARYCSDTGILGSE